MKVEEFRKENQPLRSRRKLSILYLSVSGGVSNKRLFSEARKTLLPAFIEHYNLPKDTKFKWDKRAGCFCGCSSGYIFDSKSTPYEYWGGLTLDENDPEYAEKL